MKNTKKRFLSRVALLLSVAMLAGVTVALPISAADPSTTLPEGVDEAYEINETTDLTALDNYSTTDTYYLTADLDFSGIGTNYVIARLFANIDGQGHTITVDKPLIVNFAGAYIKNLVIEGSVTAGYTKSGYSDSAPDGTSSNKYAASLALLARSAATFENITNNASINTDARSGGIVARCITNGTSFKNCVNNGTVESTTVVVGGIVGWTTGDLTFESCKNTADLATTTGSVAGILAQSGNVKNNDYTRTPVSFKGCENNGEITSTSGNAGGILAYSYGAVTVTDCINSGEVSTSKDGIGGIVAVSEYGINATNCTNTGYIHKTNANSGYTAGVIGKVSTKDAYIEGCVNTGRIEGHRIAGIAGELTTKDTTQSVKYCLNSGDLVQLDVTAGKQYVAGIVAYIYAGTGDDEVVGCVNTGNLTSDPDNTTTSPICTYANGAVVFKNNISTGTVTGTEDGYALNWFNTAGNAFGDGTGNNFVLKGSIPYTCYKDGALQDDWDTTSVVTEVTSEQLASGEVAFLLQEAGADFGQLIGTDVLPVIGSTDKVIQKLSGETKYYVNQDNVLKGTEGAAEGYIQFAAENSGYQGVRVLFVVEEAGIAEIADMKIKITFNLAEGGTKSRTESIGSYFSSVIADGAPWATEDGYVIVGVGVTGVPDNAWTSFTFELISGDGTNAAYNATASYTQPVA